MARDIKSILKKKRLTGEEVGRALLMNLANDVKNKGKRYEPLFSQADLNRMMDSLTTEAQYTEFLVYSRIYAAIAESFHRNQVHVQQFFSGYYRYLSQLRAAMQADRALEALEQGPVILTRTQYDRLRRAQVEEKRGRAASLRDMVFCALQYFLAHEDEAPEDLRAALEAARSEPATDGRVIAEFNREMGIGTFILKDGTRSEGMSNDEWRAAVLAEFMETHELITDGRQASPEETWQRFEYLSRVMEGKLLYDWEEDIRRAYGGALPEDPPLGLSGMRGALEIIAAEGDDPMRAQIRQVLDDEERGPVWHVREQPPEGTASGGFFLFRKKERTQEKPLWGGGVSPPPQRNVCPAFQKLAAGGRSFVPLGGAPLLATRTGGAPPVQSDRRKIWTKPACRERARQSPTRLSHNTAPGKAALTPRNAPDRLE
ncbi:hypothetical protein LJC74_10275 [Eubacteriales bacterium OttesenSCG-928-A19]|nr:hypothetical protein [Eubacteriales bacterium OttesenSCG-928-A19]